ncbi:hypothetical protein OAG36_01155 [bacterium]|nr:hypothetical protein [bacterium]
MAYVTKRIDSTQEDAPSTVSLTESAGSGGSAGGGGIATGGQPTQSQATVAQGPSQTAPKYVSGQTYLDANREGAQKLAGQVVEPLKQQSADVLADVDRRVNEAVTATGVQDDTSGLITKAAQDARLLDAAEKQRVQSTLAGTYGGPEGVDFSGVQEQEARIKALANQLETVGGVKQQLGDVTQQGRRYTSGMKAMDAMLLRQDPAIRQSLEAQKQLGQQVESARTAGTEKVTSAINNAKASVAERQAIAQQQLSTASGAQEQYWQDELASLQGQAAAINAAITGEAAMSASDLQLLGISAADWDKYRDAYVATSYGRDRPLTYNENYNYNLNSPTQFTAPDAYVANAWRNFQTDDFTVNPANVGMQNVVTQDDLARYQALQELQNAQQAGFVPANALADPRTGALDFNKAAANNALNAFMASGVVAPRSNLDVMEGMYGPGGYEGFTYSGPTKTPLYSGYLGEELPGYQRTDPLTGKLTTAMNYVGPKTAYGYATDAYNPNAYDYSARNAVDQAMLAERAKRSGF